MLYSTWNASGKTDNTFFFITQFITTRGACSIANKVVQSSNSSTRSEISVSLLEFYLNYMIRHFNKSNLFSRMPSLSFPKFLFINSFIRLRLLNGKFSGFTFVHKERRKRDRKWFSFCIRFKNKSIFNWK